jgi:hypothetical protein
VVRELKVQDKEMEDVPLPITPFAYPEKRVNVQWKRVFFGFRYHQRTGLFHNYGDSHVRYGTV